jgi:hypothetical protein
MTNRDTTSRRGASLQGVTGAGEQPLTVFETFVKCSILFKVKPPARRAYAPEGKAKILTAGIHDWYFED